MPPEEDGGGDGVKQPRISHRPVLLQSVIERLAPGPGMVFVDGTVGSGGHFGAVLPRLVPGGIAIGIDRDEQALLRTRAAIERLKLEGVAWHLKHAAFSELRRVVAGFGLFEVDLAMLDCGISSEQLDDPERGFSFLRDGPLDMRQDRRQTLTAAQVVNEYPEPELERILRDFGEERFAGKLAGAICSSRRERAITTTSQLAGIVAAVVPARGGKSHPATRTFQALRIEVGGEVAQLRAVMPDLAGLLSDGGRLGVITFHSLEDRVVKASLRPFSRHGGRTDWQVNQVGRVEKPSREEIESNPRARSAKLRVYQKKMLS